MKLKQDFRLNSRAIIGNWYIIKNGNDSDLCDNCADQSGILFLYDGSQRLPPFHPNCRCVLESRQNEMEEKIKRVFPTVSRQALDELLAKKYYQYEDIAIPYDFNDSMFYYDDNGKTVRINFSDIPALLRLSNGKYILGDRNETYSIYLYRLAKALEELNRLENSNTLYMVEKSVQINALFSQVKLLIADYYAEHESPLSRIQLKAKFLAWRSASRRSELFNSSPTYKDYLIDFAPLLHDAQAELSAFHLEIMEHAKKWEGFDTAKARWKNANAGIYVATVTIDKVESIAGKPLIPSSDGQIADYSKNYIQPRKLEYLSHFAPIAKDAANTYDIPILLLAGVMFSEFGGDPAISDTLGYNVRSLVWEKSDWIDKNIKEIKDPVLTSFGDVSIQLRRAFEMFGYENPSQYQQDRTIQSLENRIECIYLAAKHLSDLRDVDFKGKSATQLTNEDIRIIATRYNRGPTISLEQVREDMRYGNALLSHKKEILDAIL